MLLHITALSAPPPAITLLSTFPSSYLFTAHWLQLQFSRSPAKKKSINVTEWLTYFLKWPPPNSLPSPQLPNVQRNGSLYKTFKKCAVSKHMEAAAAAGYSIFSSVFVDVMVIVWFWFCLQSKLLTLSDCGPSQLPAVFYAGNSQL